MGSIAKGRVTVDIRDDMRIYSDEATLSQDSQLQFTLLPRQPSVSLVRKELVGFSNVPRSGSSTVLQ